MHSITALVKARNREYYRDKGSLFWSFIVTPMIVIVLAIAFSSDETPVLKAGLMGFGATGAPPFSRLPAIEPIPYDKLETAIKRVSHHQLDILVVNGEPIKYWINTRSHKGQLMEQILLGEYPQGLEKAEVSGAMIRYVDWVIPGILAMNMMFSGLWGIGYVIVRYRKNGVLKRLQATPVSAWEFLASQGLSRLMIMLAVTTIVYLVCDLFLNFMMVGSYGLLILLAILGNLSIISISLLMASRTASEELANGLLNLVSFPMLLLSEMWFSLDNAPDWLTYVSKLLPLTHLVAAARKVMLEGAGLGGIIPELLVLGLTAAVFLAIASCLFRWDRDS